MQRYIICFFGYLLSAVCLFSQKHDYVWQAGASANYPYGTFQMDFNANPVGIAPVNRASSVDRSSAPMCDANGNYLFCTNGFKVTNALGNLRLCLKLI